MIRLQWRLHVPVLIALCSISSGAAQQSGNTTAPVARLSHLAGAVQVQLLDGTDTATEAALNMPLPQGERISTGDSGEAEVEFADGSVLRLTPNSTALLGRLDSSAEVQLADGLFYLELRFSDRGSYTVYAADQTIAPQENASFRIRVAGVQVETGVLSGAVSVSRQNAYTADLQAGESLRSDPKNPKRYLLSSTLPQENWDNWNEKLSQAAQDEASLRTNARDSYAGDQGYGWADLDANGTWYSVPGEGEVWQPTLADAGFDPYGYGSWTYGPGGYAWASGYNWGWLPYRCGQWSYYPVFGWGWLPAPGCLNYGGGYGGFGGGSFPVRHPPQGWRPPQRPVNIASGKNHHPTLPYRLRTENYSAPVPRKQVEAGTPVRIGGSLATVLQPIAKGYTPQGQSAVGSSLVRDFPVHAGTHEPALGLQTQRPVAVPGRPAEWQRITPVELTADERRVGRERAPVNGDGAFYLGGTVQRNAGPDSPALAKDGADRRFPRTTDPPFNANGAPPVNAIGAPPKNATGVPGVPINAAPVAGFRDNRTGTGQSDGPPLRMRSPLQPRQPELQPVPRQPVIQTAPQPRSVAPPIAPAMPRVAPAPAPPPMVRSAPASPSAPVAPRGPSTK